MQRIRAKPQARMSLIFITALIFAMCCVLTPVCIGGVEAMELDTVSVDAKDVDIRDILVGLARDNNVNLIMDDSVQGRVSISLNNMFPLEAIELILRTNGFMTEKVGDSIVAATPGELKNILPPVSKIMTLQYASASDLKESLNAIASDQVDIVADIRTNSLIITGTPSGVRSLEQAIGFLDVEVAPEPVIPTVIKVFTLKNTQASAIREIISGLCSPAGKVQVDDLTNSLVVIDELAIIERLTGAIEQLDIPPQLTPDSETVDELYTRVFKLSYLDANALKEALLEMLSPAGTIQALVRQKESITPIRPDEIVVSIDNQSRRSQITRKSAEVKWSDILIITDTARVIERMDELISELDTRIPQVMITAKMVEVNLSNIEELGINWNAEHSPSKLALGMEFPSDNTGGLAVRVGTLTRKHFKDIMFKIQAMELNGQAKLVSNPSIITLDNELAQMIVADRIPILTTYETEFSSTTSYEFINVGIALTVIPHITEDGYILMDAMPEVSSIKEWTKGANPQPIISSRIAHSRVRVKDGQTLVIGGLIKDEQRETESRVPVLWAIPLLGRLFRSKDVENVRTDLVVFLTPQICKDDS